MKIKVADLLELLQYETVRNEIRNICQGELSALSMERNAEKGLLKTDDSSFEATRKDDSEIETLKDELLCKERLLADQAEIIFDNKRTIDGLRENIDSLERQKNSLKEQADSALNRIAAMKKTMDQTSELLAAWEMKYQHLESEHSSQFEAYEKNIAELKSRIVVAENEKARIENLYSGTERVFSLYHQLSDDTKDSLSNVICDKDSIHFVVSLSNQESIKRIWEYTKGILSNEEMVQDIEPLKEIFLYFFDLYNSSQTKPVFRLDNTQRGDEFDDELHAKSRGSASSGLIRDVILTGYVSANTGKPICKSVVNVK